MGLEVWVNITHFYHLEGKCPGVSELNFYLNHNIKRYVLSL